MDIDKVFQIVLADDDPDDRMIFEKAFQEISKDIELRLARDGSELMDMLLEPGAIIPEIIFLDLNMPCKNGFECLEEIKGNEELKNIFIVICSTSGNLAEIEETFQKGANLFMKKFNSFQELKTALGAILMLDRNDYLTSRRKEKFVFSR